MRNAAPYLQQRGNTFSFRLGVPRELRGTVGKREIVLALGISDVRSARLAALQLAATTQRIFLELGLAMADGDDDVKRVLLWRLAKVTVQRHELQDAHDRQIDEVRREMRAQQALVEAENSGLRAAMGAGLAPAAKVVPAVSWTLLFDGWVTERKPRKKTCDSYRSRIQDLVKFLGYDDVARVTPDDVVRWKEELISRGLQAGTINDGYLAAGRTVCAFGVANRRIKENPFSNVSVLKPREVTESSRLPFTDSDAALMLGKARNLTGWHRWVPFLLAYTGCRIEEAVGAMAADVRCEGGVHYLDLRPEHRALKNLVSRRRVPLHSALVSEGFVAYAAGLPSGSPLFPDAVPDKYEKRSASVSKVMGRWIRRLGIEDPRKVAAHSWRHRFADLCRAAGVPRDVRFALEGHKSADVGDDYGSGFTLTALHEAMERLPVQG